VHGARQGQPSDLFVFRARRLHRAGFNVALPVLPVHGARALRTSATFPTLDLLDNLHAITQGVSDLRQTLAWIREQDAPAIAVHGLSLGGHLAAMLVGLEGDIAAAVAGVPMASVVGVIGAHVSRPVTGDAEVAAYLASEPATALDRLMSPFEVTPLVRRERLHVYGGYGDGMSTFGQSEALWRHWGRPAHCWYAGGHVGAVWSTDVQRFVEDALRPLAPPSAA
jgi:acetyl esterase/lipase